MDFNELAIDGVFSIQLKPLGDARGWFARTFCKDIFAEHGLNGDWQQMNHSFTAQKGTIRGMHFQYPPHQEIKMVRCIAGAVYDVIIDLREGSPTFLQYVGLELSAANTKMIYIPKGFAHGFQTISENAELVYQHSAEYNPKAEGGIRFDDPAVGIVWPLPVADTSEKDKQHLYIDKAIFKGI
ncbi:dTDP-4-dehydrorhamnose 3,5-epimerase [Parasediminibacterium sp. JCM 36343]|uniref:dTDP-4-dehydrorhamnose 3,5-epimerase n=1 Tax=Parasediminibacterium sp. JCM 36343 TaxID=3374279 RepID=UPI00397A35D5